MSGALDEVEEAVLVFAGRWWRSTGARDEAIRVELDMSPTGYFRVLNRLLDDERAWAAHPVTVQRWIRIRDSNRTGTVRTDRAITRTMGGTA